MWRSIKTMCHLSKTKKEAKELLTLQNSLDNKSSLNISSRYFAAVGQKLASTILNRIANAIDLGCSGC